jgi:hypothetical protein
LAEVANARTIWTSPFLARISYISFCPTSLIIVYQGWHLGAKPLSKTLFNSSITSAQSRICRRLLVLYLSFRQVAPPKPTDSTDMADTPSIPLPLNPKEQPILENLQRIRDELTLLKQDRTTYVKSADVIVLYDKVVEQVKLLNDIRAEKPEQENRGRSFQCSPA